MNKWEVYIELFNGSYWGFIFAKIFGGIFGFLKNRVFKISGSRVFGFELFK